MRHSARGSGRGTFQYGHIINAKLISMVQDLFHAAEKITPGVICTEQRGKASCMCVSNSIILEYFDS
jgi:hypothetical protein